MINFRLILILAILFPSCIQKKEAVPEKVIQFTEEAIEASINTYPLNNFYQAYFDQSVPQEYIDKLSANAIIWRGLEHNSELRQASLISAFRGNNEYLLKYWVAFKDNRKFSYTINVFDKNGEMTLRKFEPLDVNIASTFYSPDTNFDIPDFASNRTKIYFTYTLIFATLLFVIVLAFRKQEYLLLLTIPFLFVYEQGMSIISFDGIEILSPKTHFGFPIFQNIDLHFTSISITTTGVFLVWLIIGLFLFFSGKRNKSMLYNNV
ncbi:MAG: hypothetical protein CMO01_15225 [Thalassobius sp.]|nr:hypothetical protein [Thalassovita sp.]